MPVSYTHLNDQIDELFNWIENEPTLQRKADLILAQYENTNDNESLYLSMVTSVFLESFLFYSGFFYPLYLAGQGKMVASGEIILSLIHIFKYQVYFFMFNIFRY